jgi:hypothetical protein
MSNVYRTAIAPGEIQLRRKQLAILVDALEEFLWSVVHRSHSRHEEAMKALTSTGGLKV